MNCYDILQKKRQELFKLIQVKKEDEKEKQLTSFFMALKNFEASPNEGGILDREAYELLKQNVLRSNQSFKSFFKVRGGLNFEKRMGQLIVGLAKSVSDNSIDIQNSVQKILTGQQTSTTELSKNLFNKMVKSPVIKEHLLEQGLTTKQYFMNPVQQKVDIDASNLEVQFASNANPKLAKILALVQQCQFQTKNYSPLIYSFKERKQSQWRGSYFLLFGSSQYRFFNSVLSALNTSPKEIETLYGQALKLYQQNKELRRIIWHFKQVYEIAGVGAQGYQSKERLKPVNYIVFNDPTSDFITVKAVSTLLFALLSNKNTPANPFTATVMVNKETFGQTSKAISNYINNKLNHALTQ